jgi:hypothetical protein
MNSEAILNNSMHFCNNVIIELFDGRCFGSFSRVRYTQSLTKAMVDFVTWIWRMWYPYKWSYDEKKKINEEGHWKGLLWIIASLKVLLMVDLEAFPIPCIRCIDFVYVLICMSINIASLMYPGNDVYLNLSYSLDLNYIAMCSKCV